MQQNFARISRFFRRHPSVREALRWALPAMVFGGFLRACLLHYMPYAYWGADSRSYFDFSYKLFGEHYISLIEKRRFFYPIFVAFVTMLPGAPLKWLPWIQHAISLATLVPLGYVVRKNFVLWKWWIVPITLLYTAHPVILWYEHELLAENIFFALVIWSAAGWTAWAAEPPGTRSGRLWWWFFVPFALFILTRPAGRFMWPGVFLGFVLVAAWRRFAWPQWASLAALMVVTLFVGAKQHGAWLLYTATFPLTQLQRPLHAEYKAEIREMVAPLHAELDRYYENDGGPFTFLENPRRKPELPLWSALPKNPALQHRVYMDLAKEAIRAEPLNFLKMGLHRLAKSSNLSEFKINRFDTAYFARFDDDYQDAGKRLAAHEPTPVPLALGFPAKGPIPPYAEVRPRLMPAAGAWSERLVGWWVRAYQAHATMVAIPPKRISDAGPTWLGWLLLVGAALACALPRYRWSLGVWTLAATSYLCGVFLVTQVNPRYFGAAWGVLILLGFVGADVVGALFCKRSGERLAR
jgi:hypothetical protein